LRFLLGRGQKQRPLGSTSRENHQSKNQCRDTSHDPDLSLNESYLSTRMNETEFISNANQMLEKIATGIDAAGLDCDCGFKGEGILEIEFDDGAKVIINRNTPAREIWLAAASGGFHFRCDAGQWVDTRDGVELSQRLSRVLGTLSGRDVPIDPR